MLETEKERGKWFETEKIVRYRERARAESSERQRKLFRDRESCE